MSDRVALNGRSTCDECTCDRNTREPILNRTQARLVPKPPVFESRRVRGRPRKHVSLTITITTKLPIKLYISNTTTLIHGQKQSWE